MTVRVLASGLSGIIGRNLNSSVVDLGIRLERVVPYVGEALDNSVVLHLAALVGEDRVRRDLSHSYSINVTGAVELARVVYRSKAKRFVYVSTSHVYEQSPDAKPLYESHSVLPRSQYALQKLIAEELISDVFRDDPSRLTIARVFSVLHRSQPPGTLGFIIDGLLSNSEQRLRFADDKRDFLSPRTVASTLLSLANQPTAPPIVNICSGIAITVREAARLLLGDDIFSSVQHRLIPGQSSSPSIVGSPHLLARCISQTGSELFGASLVDWIASRPSTE